MEAFVSAAAPVAHPQSVLVASSGSRIRSQIPDQRPRLSSRRSALFGADVRRFEHADKALWHADVTCMAKPAPSSTPSTSAPPTSVPPVPLIAGGLAIAAAALYCYKNWPEIQEKLKKGELFKGTPLEGSVDEDDDGEPKKGPVLYNYECTKCGMVIFPAPHAKIWTKFMDKDTGELREDFKCTNPKCGAGREAFVKKIPKKFDPNRPPPPPSARPAPAPPAPAAPAPPAPAAEVAESPAAEVVEKPAAKPAAEEPEEKPAAEEEPAAEEKPTFSIADPPAPKKSDDSDPDVPFS